MNSSTQEMRTGKELIAATRAFAKESTWRSWWHVVSTLVLTTAAAGVAAFASPWPLRLLASTVAGLLVVRIFILYHDHLHGAILRTSKPAKLLFMVYGWLVLTPRTVWKQTHHYHHAHTAKIVGSHIGSYMVVTKEMWAEMSTGQRLMYRINRHPLTIALGYFTIFTYGMCFASFFRNPRKNWESLWAVFFHFSIAGAIAHFLGWDVLFFGYVFPTMVACASGGYLFYAQHNFEGIHIQPRESWDFVRAAMESSSFMKMGPIMNFFTGNIGYHHIHHLNPMIPFYRLPEAMAEIPELQSPPTTTLRLSDVIGTFRLKIWDKDAGRMVGYPR